MITLWTKMGELFGAKFINQYGDVNGPAFATWCQAMADLLPTQVEQGFINLCRDHPQYVPDALEFREYCINPTSFGLPAEREAYLEAMHHAHEWQTWKWSHPAVFAALSASNIPLMRQLLEHESVKIFYRNYKIICRKVMSGLPYEVPIPPALPEKVPEPVTPEEGLRQIAKLKALLDE